MAIRSYKTLRGRQLVQQLKAGKVGVIPTDTLYGLVGSALNQEVVERIYRLRRRDTKKPMIILIGGIAELKKFGIKPDQITLKFLKRYWPGEVSVVLRCPSKRWAYLHRGGGTLAFRWPKSTALEKLLRQTGPLVAPSANWAGEPPAATVKQAQKYFSGEMDFYVNTGKLTGKPSTVVRLAGGKPQILREGDVKIGIWI